MPKPVIFIPGFPASELRDSHNRTVFPPSPGTLLDDARKKDFFDTMLDIPGDLVAGPPIRSVLGVAKQAQSLYDVFAPRLHDRAGWRERRLRPHRLGLEARRRCEADARCDCEGRERLRPEASRDARSLDRRARLPCVSCGARRQHRTGAGISHRRAGRARRRVRTVVVPIGACGQQRRSCATHSAIKATVLPSDGNSNSYPSGSSRTPCRRARSAGRATGSRFRQRRANGDSFRAAVFAAAGGVLQASSGRAFVTMRSEASMTGRAPRFMTGPFPWPNDWPGRTIPFIRRYSTIWPQRSYEWATASITNQIGVCF